MCAPMDSNLYKSCTENDTKAVVNYLPLLVHTSCEESVLHCPELLQIAIISAAGEKSVSH